jgi:hypothetical protein
MRKFLVLGASGLLLVTSIAANSAIGPTKTVSFKSDVQPILNENCVACHQSGSAERGLVLEAGKAYQNIVNIRSKESKLNLITPGQPDQSYLLHKLSGTQKKVAGSGEQMPLGDPLPPAKVLVVQRWIAAGAPHN